VTHSPVMASRSLRLATVALVLLPVFPALLLNQSGISHTAECTVESGEPFSVVISANAAPIISSAVVLTTDSPQPKQCAGFDLLLSAQPKGPNGVNVIVAVTNSSGKKWSGTALLTVNDVTTAVRLGTLATDRLNVRKIYLTPGIGETTISAKLTVGI
jgi:hypothetical protein